MDIAIALLPSLFYGFTAIVMMSLGGDPRQQSMGQLLGGFLVAVVMLPVAGFMPSWQDNAVSLLAGASLAVGLTLQVRLFHTIGVSRTMPLSTGGQIVGISLLGILLMGEWSHPGAMPTGLAGLALIVAGVAATSWTQKAVGEPVAWRGSVSMLVVSTVALCAYVLLLRLFYVDPLASAFPVACGFLVAGFFLNSPRRSPQYGPVDTRWSKYTVRQILSGLIWGTGTVIMQYSTANYGVALGFTLSQLGVAISALGAVWLLGEKRTRREWWVMVAGIALLIGGTVLVGMAKALDV